MPPGNQNEGEDTTPLRAAIGAPNTSLSLSLSLSLLLILSALSVRSASSQLLMRFPVR